MATDILFEERVEKDLKKTPSHIKKKFSLAIESLKVNPLSGFPLSGELKGKRKIRLGDYRIIYKFFPEEKLIVIYKVESRQGVYKN